jgi:hypothetical protein
VICFKRYNYLIYRKQRYIEKIQFSIFGFEYLSIGKYVD